MMTCNSSDSGTGGFSFTMSDSVKYVVLIHYCYPALSFVRSKIFASKTLCTGVHISLDTTLSGILVLSFILGPKEIFSNRKTDIPIHARTKRPCTVISFTKNVDETVIFFFKTGFRIFNFKVSYPEGPWIRERQFYVFKIRYHTHLLGNIATFESMNDRSLQILYAKNALGKSSVRSLRNCDATFRSKQTAFRNSAHRAITIEKNPFKHAHSDFYDKVNDVEFLSGTQNDKFAFLISDKDIDEGWATMTIQLAHCREVFSHNYLSFLSTDVVQYHMNMHCKVKMFKDKNSGFNFTRFVQVNQFSLIRISSLESDLDPLDQRNKHLITGSKVAMEYEAFSLKWDITELWEIYIASNLSHNKHSGRLTLHYSIYLPSFQVVLPSNFIILNFPAAMLPSCFIPPDHQAPLLCHNNFLVSNVLLSQVQHLKLINQTKQKTVISKPNLDLLHQCSERYCFTQFISWNDAKSLCRQTNLYLPEVFSKSDMNILRDQIKRFDCRHSILFVAQKYKVKVSYHTIAIYIGLRNLVCFIFLPFCVGAYFFKILCFCSFSLFNKLKLQTLWMTTG